MFRNKNNNPFKQTYDKVFNEFWDIKDGIKDPAQQLKRFSSLREKFNNLYGNGRVQKSVDKIDLSENYIGLVSSLSGVSTGIVIGAALAVSLPAAPIIIPIAAAAVLSEAVFLGIVHMAYKWEAKATGLTIKDVKYAIKTHDLKNTLDKAIKRASVHAEVNEALKSSAAPAASKPKAPAPRR